MKKRIITLSLFGALALGALPTHAATLPLMDSSQMNLTAINAVRGETVVSVGLIMAWGAGNSPQDPEKWFECDGRTFSAAVYPDLAMIYPTLRVPDYRDQFLRGGASSQVGQTASDTTRSHYHSQPTHTHTVNTMLSSTALRIYP